MAKNEKNFKFNKYSAFAFVWLSVFLVVFSIVLFNGRRQVKAETSFYDMIGLDNRYILDYVSPANYNDNGITIINNQDGTFTLNGTATAVCVYNIPFTIGAEAWQGDYLIHGIYRVNPASGYVYTPNNSNKITGLSYRLYNTSSNFSNYSTAGDTIFNTTTNLNNFITNSANDNKKMALYIAQGTEFTNITILPFFFQDVKQQLIQNSAVVPMIYYVCSVVGPKPNEDVFFTATAPNGSYYIYQKINSQFNINILPAIRYTLTADISEITKDPALSLESANIEILKLTAPNGNIYRVYYDNITGSTTKDSYFVDDNGTTTILQNADGSGLINSTGLDALILAFQHALTYNAVITTAERYIFSGFNDKLYVFDTDFGYAKGVADGSANYQPGRPGYQTIYDEGKDYGEQQKDLYYGNYYGGSNGVGGAGYMEIYNAGEEAGATITTSWLTTVLNTVVVVFALELLPGIKLGYIIGAPFVITVIWFIIRQFRGGGGG